MTLKNNNVNCDFCKKEYFVTNYAYNRIISGEQKTHCCSKECADKLKIINNEEKRNNWTKLKCDFCNKEFRVRPFEYKEKLKNGLFIACSRECAQKLMGQKHRGSDSPKYKERVSLICQYCNKEFLITEFLSKDRMYCSEECMRKARKQNSVVFLLCQYCGKEFEVTKGDVDFWGEIKYCSKECRHLGRRNRVELNCVICGKPYIVSNNRKNISICCSRECLAVWNSTVYTERPEVKDRLRKQGTKSQLNQKNAFTFPEIKVLEYLHDIDINFIPQFPIDGELIIDFFLPDYNCCLEVYGDYWHANPLKYGKGKRELNEMQIKNKQRDIRKYKVLTTKYNYYFYSLWEYDIINDLENSINKFFKYIDFKIRNE